MTLKFSRVSIQSIEYPRHVIYFYLTLMGVFLQRRQSRGGRGAVAPPPKRKFGDSAPPQRFGAENIASVA